uniref:endo-polygalacturonase n=1 Tax=Lygus lineolaris TaxID=50650 RepID=A0A126CMW5_LYGLI|nr:polygalacturonase 17 [Lygus lineolaris]
MRSIFVALAGLILVVADVFGVEVNNLQQLADAKKGGEKLITIKNLEVPAGVTLDLDNLQAGTTVEFAGKVTFGYTQWLGPLIKITGKNIKIEGKPGHVIDGDGARWWDGKGGNGGRKKPRFIYFQASDSVITGLRIKNSPVHCFAVNGCNNVHLTDISMDNRDGRVKGHNTDAFDVANSDGVFIKNCDVYNQDDCLAINSGRNIVFENNTCTGGHGISIGSVGNGAQVEKVLVKGCKVSQSTLGIRIKTKKDESCLLKDITFDDIVLKNIKKRGINIQGNYKNSGPTGPPSPNCPIQNLVINNVRGNVDSKGTNIAVWVANASNWFWNSRVTGGKRELPCKGVPAGMDINCGKAA